MQVRSAFSVASISTILFTVGCATSPELGTSSSAILLEEQTITPIYMPDLPYVKAEDLLPKELTATEKLGNLRVRREFEFSDGTTEVYQTVGNLVIEGGDIIVSTLDNFEEELEARNEAIEAGDQPTLTAQGGLFYNTRGWPGGIIYFDPNSLNAFSSIERTSIQNAMQHITNETNVGFLPRTTSNRLYFRNSGGCSSFLGMWTTIPQNLYLGDDCFADVNPADNFGTIVHELTHAAALIHEHQRGDRNDYIDILESNLTDLGYDNIIPLARTSYRTGYDYPSVMHYARRIQDTAFVKNPNINTITTPGYTGVVASQRLTPRDKQTYNHLYP